MGSLQSELVRTKFADPVEYSFDLAVQAASSELQVSLRRLKSLEGKFSLMKPATKLLLAIQDAEAVTIEQKKRSIDDICNYLETL